MRLLPINAFDSSNSKIPAFNGLMKQGLRHQTFSIDTYERVNTYYPFMDEPESEIAKHLYKDKIKEEHVLCADDYTYPEEITVYESSKLGERLPFDKQNWELYSKNKYLMNVSERNIIENGLKKLELFEFIDYSLVKYLKAGIVKFKQTHAIKL